MGRFIFVSFGLLVVFLSLSATAADCPSDWSTYGQYCYKYFQEWMKWDKAERFCSKQAMGGHLVSIESAEEADFVAELLVQNKHRPQYYVWIGLRVQNKEKQCRSEWSDGSSFSYENLMEAYLKKCFALKGFVQWVNIYCGQHNVFICKFLRPH